MRVYIRSKLRVIFKENLIPQNLQIINEDFLFPFEIFERVLNFFDYFRVNLCILLNFLTFFSVLNEFGVPTDQNRGFLQKIHENLLRSCFCELFLLKPEHFAAREEIPGNSRGFLTASGENRQFPLI